jgi:DNA-binding LacI/PurR family transcriptional regulator
VMVGYEQKVDNDSAPLHHMLTEGAQLNCKFELSVVPETDVASQTDQLVTLARDVEGVVLDGFVRPELLERASASLAAPVVLIGNTYGDPLLPAPAGCQVTTDMRSMGHLAARVLLRAGHRRVAFVCTSLFENLYYEQWLAGFRHAHADLGVPLDPKLLLITGNVVNKNILAARPFLANDENRPTAAVVPDSGTARTVLDTLRASAYELPREAVVIGGSREQAARDHLDQHPFIGINLDKLSRATLEILVAASRAGEPPRAQKVLIPFETHNLPAGVTGGN